MRPRIPRATLAIAASAALAAGMSQAADSSDAGAKVYAEQCASCHDPTGAGIAGFGSPSLAPAIRSSLTGWSKST